MSEIVEGEEEEEEVCPGISEGEDRKGMDSQPTPFAEGGPRSR